MHTHVHIYVYICKHKLLSVLEKSYPLLLCREHVGKKKKKEKRKREEEVEGNSTMNKSRSCCSNQAM